MHHFLLAQGGSRSLSLDNDLLLQVNGWQVIILATFAILQAAAGRHALE